MLEKLKSLEEKYERVAALMADPAVAGDPSKYREHARAYSELGPVVAKYREYGRTVKELDQAKTLVRETEDEGMRQLAREEELDLAARVARLEDELKALLLPKDPNDEKNVLLEIRAGTGGDEATLFAQEIYRMYTRFAERHGWKVQLMSAHES